MRIPGLMLAAAAASAGCAVVPPDAGFADVQAAVEPRLGIRPQWNRLSPSDGDVRQAVRGLLSAELTAESAVNVALLNNRRLQAVYEDLGVSQADVVQAGLLSNPTFYGEIRFPPKPSLPFEIDVTRDFVDLIVMPLRRRLAQTQFGQAKLRVSDAVLATATDVKSAYFSLAAAMQQEEMRRTVRSATAASADMAIRLFRAGNINNLDRDREQDMHEQARLDLEQAEADTLECRERLAALMGVWGADADFRIAGRLPELPREEAPAVGLETAAVSQRFDLAAARHEVEAAAQEAGVARLSAVLPNLTVGVHVEHEADTVTTAGPSIELAVPLFDQGQARSARAAALLRQAGERYAALAVEIRSQVRSARNRMYSARRRAMHYRAVVLPLRERIVRESLLHYNAMQIGVFQLLAAKQEQIEAGRRYIDALRDYWLARTDLERAIGGRLPEASAPASGGRQPPDSADSMMPPNQGTDVPRSPNHQHH